MILGDRCRNGTAKRSCRVDRFDDVQRLHEGLVMKKILVKGALITGALLLAGSAMAADLKAPGPC
jgi:hypothetical protein